MSDDLRARIRDALDADDHRYPHARMPGDVRELLPLVLAELDALKQDLEDQCGEHLRAEALRAALAAEHAAHADTERQLRDALARERAERTIRMLQEPFGGSEAK